MKLIPLSDRLLVEPTPLPEMTSGGVVLPETARHDDVDEGIVLDCDNAEHSYLVDSKVVYTKHSGSQVKIDGKDYLLLPFKNIMAFYVDGAQYDV